MKPFLAAAFAAALVPVVASAAPAAATDPQAPARYAPDGPGGGCAPAQARLRPGPHSHGVRERNELTSGEVTQIEKEIRAVLTALDLFQPEPSTVPPPRPTGRPPHRWAPVSISVYFHVLHAGRTGNIPDDRIRRQIQVLNQAHSGNGPGADTDFTFTLRAVTRTDNAAWYRDPQRYEREYKAKLHKGGSRTLNLYSADMGQQMLGWSTFPWRYRAEPAMDGVVVHPESLPGGRIRNFNLGHTATHEIGHWLGLYHTFQDGCSATGDRVDDTPAERDPTNGCPASKDTCPAAGSDPIHNFMDYSYDPCMNQFTPGQSTRMHQAWTAYRA